MTLVAIHQPNFFPWLGYFQKIAQSDAFVFLDHVQLPKTGGTWSNRVKLLVKGEARWATAPMDRSFRGVRAINEMEFQRDVPWRQNFLNLLSRNYEDAPFYAETMRFLMPLIMQSENNIARYNICAVIKIAEHLGLFPCKFFSSSNIKPTGQSNHMLISLVRAVNGEAYLYGGGADGYQDEALFVASGIRLIPQNFVHPEYSQQGKSEQVAGLSIIDALMNLGFLGAAQLVRGHDVKGGMA